MKYAPWAECAEYSAMYGGHVVIGQNYALHCLGSVSYCFTQYCVQCKRANGKMKTKNPRCLVSVFELNVASIATMTDDSMCMYIKYHRPDPVHRWLVHNTYIHMYILTQFIIYLRLCFFLRYAIHKKAYTYTQKLLLDKCSTFGYYYL